MSLLENLPHRATAKRRSRTKDEIGGTKDVYTTVFEDRPCWRQPASDGEVTEFQRRGIRVTHRVYFVVDPNLDERHTLEIDGDVMTVRSHAHPDNSSGLGRLYRVMVELEDLL